MRNIADKHNRVISTALLNVLLHLHMRPINQVVFLDSQGKSYLRNRLALRCFQRLSVPCLATRRYCWRNNRNTRGMSFPVLSYWGMNPSNFQRSQRIEDRTVSRRSEPSSRTTLIGEQPNPWDLLQPQDKMSRHRCRGSSFHEWFMISLLIPRRKYRFLSWDRLILLWGSDYIFTLIYN